MTAVCEDYYHLDLAWLQRRKMLTPGRKSVITWSSCGRRTGAIKIAAAAHAILLVYRTREYGEEWQDVKQLVVFKTTATAFGGRRRWFACPGCAKACRVLYGSGRFLCRRCWRLPYRSQRESPWSRTTSRMQKMRARLGGSANLMEPFPPRPRYMHHRTYQRLWARYISLSRKNTADLAAFAFRLTRRAGIRT
jgi:hypothetical protein